MALSDEDRAHARRAAAALGPWTPERLKDLAEHAQAADAAATALEKQKQRRAS